MEPTKYPFDVSAEINGHDYKLSDGTELHFLQLNEDGSRVGTVTSEELLLVLLNRTVFLNDKFPCEENKIAIASIQNAIRAFDLRTSNRINRGVEGTHQA